MTAPFEIDPLQVSDEASRYMNELRERLAYLTPAEREWYDQHREFLDTLKEEK